MLADTYYTDFVLHSHHYEAKENSFGLFRLIQIDEKEVKSLAQN